MKISNKNLQRIILLAGVDHYDRQLNLTDPSILGIKADES